MPSDFDTLRIEVAESQIKHWRDNHDRQLSIKRRLHDMYVNERREREALESRVKELEAALAEALLGITEDVWPDEPWPATIDRWRAVVPRHRSRASTRRREEG